MTKTTESKWRALIAEQERSGRSVREFAAVHGINPTTLYWWRSKLRRDCRDRTKLVPVEVVEHRVDIDSAGVGGFELQVDGAMTLRVPTGFDEAELRRLIRALRC